MLGDFEHLGPQALDHLAAPDRFGDDPLLAAQVLVFPRQPVRLQRPLHGQQQLGHGQRFLDEIVGAQPGRFHRGFDRAVPGHHDDRTGQMVALAPFLEQADAIGVGHPDVEQDQIGPLGAPGLAGGGGIFGGGDGVAFILQNFLYQVANIRFVIDDQNIRRVHPASFSVCNGTAGTAGDPAPSRNSGNRIAIRAPPSGGDSNWIQPPCSSTIFLTIANPSPVPLGLVVTYGSKALARMLVGKSRPIVAHAQLGAIGSDDMLAAGTDPQGRTVAIADGLDGVLDQIVQQLAQANLVGLDRQRFLGQLQLDLHPGGIVAVEIEHLGDKLVQFQRRQLQARRAGVFAEGVHHFLHRLHLLNDGVGAALQHPALFFVELLEIFVADALGGELDRRQRILDLVSQAAGDLGPGGVALGPHQVGDVVEHDDVAAPQADRVRQRTAAAGQNPPPGAAEPGDLLPPVAGSVHLRADRLDQILQRRLRGDDALVVDADERG